MVSRGVEMPINPAPAPVSAVEFFRQFAGELRYACRMPEEVNGISISMVDMAL